MRSPGRLGRVGALAASIAMLCMTLGAQAQHSPPTYVPPDGGGGGGGSICYSPTCAIWSENQETGVSTCVYMEGAGGRVCLANGTHGQCSNT